MCAGQNDDPWGWGRKLGGPWEQKEPQLRFGERDAHGKTTTEILDSITLSPESRPLGVGRKPGGPWEQKEPHCGSGSETPTERQLPRFCTSCRMTALGGWGGNSVGFGSKKSRSCGSGSGRPRKDNYRDSARRASRTRKSMRRRAAGGSGILAPMANRAARPSSKLAFRATRRLLAILSSHVTRLHLHLSNRLPGKAQDDGLLLWVRMGVDSMARGLTCAGRLG